jgi:hypothetical protein
MWLAVSLMALAILACPRASLSAQTPAASSPLEFSASNELGSLKISLRLEDETPFQGASTVQVMPVDGYELLGMPEQDKGDVLFFAVGAGQYLVQVTAPGFQTVQLKTDLEAGNRERTIFVVMKRRGVPQAVAKSPEAATAEPAPKAELAASTITDLPAPSLTDKPPATDSASTAASTLKKRWTPAEWVDTLSVDHSVACPLDKVLQSAGERVKEFVSSMERFTAEEMVEHYSIDKNGDKRGPETRKFAYVVMVSRDTRGNFSFDEFRNGNTDPAQFPANLATMGLPTIVLVFHPDYSDSYSFSCDGLAHDGAHEYWQVHFKQRNDKPARIETYVVNGQSFPLKLEGRAWIDPGKGEVVHLESQLAEPIPQIELWEQHQNIYYTGVKFTAGDQRIWLPQSAEVYAERHGKRYFRRHTFRDFRLFNVDSAQNVKAPKGSYTFTNLTDSDVRGELTVTPVEGVRGGPVSLRFFVPPHGTVIKTVGPGKDVGLPPAEIGSAKFVHSGDAGAVKVDVDLVKETTLDVIPESARENP